MQEAGMGCQHISRGSHMTCVFILYLQRPRRYYLVWVAAMPSLPHTEKPAESRERHLMLRIGGVPVKRLLHTAEDHPELLRSLLFLFPASQQLSSPSQAAPIKERTDQSNRHAEQSHSTHTVTAQACWWSWAALLHYNHVQE